MYVVVSFCIILLFFFYNLQNQERTQSPGSQSYSFKEADIIVRDQCFYDFDGIHVDVLLDLSSHDNVFLCFPQKRGIFLIGICGRTSNGIFSKYLRCLRFPNLFPSFASISSTTRDLKGIGVFK